MADSVDLCKIEDVKDWLKISPTTPTSDATLKRLITAVSRDFMTAIDRHDLTPVRTYIEVVYLDRRNPEDIRDNRLLFTNRPLSIAVAGLRHWPIQSVTAVTIDGTVIVASDGTVDGYFWDENTEDEYRNTLLIINATSPGYGRYYSPQAAVVEYDAGYDSVPEDIEQAVIEWVAFRYTSRQFIGQMSKHSTQGEAVQYSQADMPATTKSVIDRYSRSESLL